MSARIKNTDMSSEYLQLYRRIDVKILELFEISLILVARVYAYFRWFQVCT